MKDTRDQHAGQSPPGLPSGVHDAHKGGNATSSATPRAARPNCAMRAKTTPGWHDLWEARSRTCPYVSAATAAEPDWRALLSLSPRLRARKRGKEQSSCTEPRDNPTSPRRAIRYKYTICHKADCRGQILAKRTNFGIPNEINTVRFACRGNPGSLAAFRLGSPLAVIAPA